MKAKSRRIIRNRCGLPGCGKQLSGLCIGYYTELFPHQHANTVRKFSVNLSSPALHPQRGASVDYGTATSTQSLRSGRS